MREVSVVLSGGVGGGGEGGGTAYILFCGCEGGARGIVCADVCGVVGGWMGVWSWVGGE